MSGVKMAKAVKSAKGKCSCNVGWLIIALVLLTVGLWGVVAGFTAQFGGAAAATVLPWYFVGLLLIVLGKWAKWNAHGRCTVHGMR